MAVIGMKTLAKGYLLPPRGAHTLTETMGYALSQDIDLAIIGCDNPAQVVENAKTAAAFKPLPRTECARLEALASSNRFTWWFKKPV